MENASWASVITSASASIGKIFSSGNRRDKASDGCKNSGPVASPLPVSPASRKSTPSIDKPAARTTFPSLSGAAPNTVRNTRSTLALQAFHEEKEIDKSADLSLLRSLWPFIRSEKKMLVASFVALVALAVASLGRPLVMRHGFDGSGSEPELLKAGFTLLGLVMFEQIVSFVQMLAVQTAGARAMLQLRVHVFKFLHGRRVGFFDNQPVGRLVTRVTNDIDAIGELFASGALNAVGDVLKLVGIVAMMLLLDWKLALIAFAALPPIGLLVNLTRKRLRDAYREIRVKTARLNAFLAEQVHGMSVTQALSLIHI